MEKKAVLVNEEDRRKYTHPKKKQKARPSRPEQDKDEDHMIDRKDQQGQEMESHKPRDKTHPQEKREEHVQNTNSSTQEDDPKPCHEEEFWQPQPNVPLENNFPTLSHAVMKNYTLAWAGINISKEIIREVVYFHLNPQGNRLTRVTFDILSKCYFDHFETFANKSMPHSRIDEGDINLLVKKNGTLVFHYYMARYLSADNGVDQLTWLLGPHAPTLSKLTYDIVIWW